MQNNTLLCPHIVILKVETKKRFDTVITLKKTAGRSVDDAREYVEAMLGLQVWSHTLYGAAVSGPHEKKGEHNHGDAHSHG